MDFEKMLEKIMRPMKEVLDKKDKKRGKIFPLSRAIIDKSKKDALLLHRGKLVEGGNLLAEAGIANEGLRKILEEYPDLYYSGIHDAQKELAEGMIFFSILSDVDIPGPEDIGVEYPAYLNGHLRHTLDMVRGTIEVARGKLTDVAIRKQDQSREEIKQLPKEIKQK